MHPIRYTLLTTAAICALLAPAAAQETSPPADPPSEAAPATPAAEPPAPDAAAPADAPAQPDAPETGQPETDTPQTGQPEPGQPEAAQPEPGQPETDAPDGALGAGLGQPDIAVSVHGDWEVGCLADTTNCEMLQVASDGDGNPVVLARIVRLPAGSEAQALAVFNTPLGTLLPTGLGFRIDSGQNAALPFEWCVQEGCIVRLGLREPDVAAMKRGRAVTLSVASIAEPDSALELNLSLAGFTAAYDMLTEPPAPPEPAQ